MKTSTVDVDAVPIHEASGKSITEVDMDAGRYKMRAIMLVAYDLKILAMMIRHGGGLGQIRQTFSITALMSSHGQTTA